jgi:hypothetical protein
MTRSRWLPGVCLALALVLAAPTLASAQGATGRAGHDRARRAYRGKTSQNARAFIGTVKNDGNWGIEELDFGFKMRCQDGSKFRLGAGIGFGRPVWLDSRKRFAIDENFGDAAFHVHGRLGPNAGSGTVEFTMAQLTQDEQAEVCTSKERTWTVKRVVTPPPTPVPTGSSSSKSMYVRIDANGKTRITSS